MTDRKNKPLESFAFYTGVVNQSSERSLWRNWLRSIIASAGYGNERRGAADILVASRCWICRAPLEHPLGEFMHDLEGAIEEAREHNSARIPLMCPPCTQMYLDERANRKSVRGPS